MSDFQVPKETILKLQFVKRQKEATRKKLILELIKINKQFDLGLGVHK